MNSQQRQSTMSRKRLSSIRKKFEDADQRMRERDGKKKRNLVGKRSAPSKWRQSQKIGRTGPRKSVRRHESSIGSFTSVSSNSSSRSQRADSVRRASHRSSLRRVLEEEEEKRHSRSTMGGRNGSWRNTIRKKWKSSSSLSSMASTPISINSSASSLSDVVKGNSSNRSSNIRSLSSNYEECDEDKALETVNNLLRNHDSSTPIVYRQIKLIVTNKFDASLFDRIKPQVQEMLYVFTKKGGKTLEPTPRYKAASAMALCSDSIVQGILYKKTRWTGKWNKRYFQLDCLESRIRYWKTEQCPSDNDLCSVESSFRNFQVTNESKPRTYLRNPGSDLPWAFAVKLWEPKSNGFKTVHLAALSPSEHWDWVNAFEKASEHWINTSKTKDSSSSIMSKTFLASNGKSFFANLLNVGGAKKSNKETSLKLSVRSPKVLRRKRKSPAHSLNKFVKTQNSHDGTSEGYKKAGHLHCFGVSLDKVRMINVREQKESVPVVLAFLAHLLRAPIPAEEGRPHLTDGLMFPHLFREEPEESLKESAMFAIDAACSYHDEDNLNEMNIRLRDINRSLAFNRPLLASAIKIYLNRLPSKLLEKVESRLVASLLADMTPPYKTIPPKIMSLLESLEDSEISVLKWLLRFLADVASKSEGMDVKAVAICLSPVMFKPIPIDMSNPTESIRLQTSFVAASSGLLQWLIETQYKDRFVVDPDPLL